MTPSRSGWAPAEPAQRPALLINPGSGGGKASRARLAERARGLGIRTLCLTPDRTVGALVADALAHGADALGVAGGDGSLALVAAVAAAHDLPFVCIPAGTRNHFARDLGMDVRDLPGALDAFGDGVERRVDLAEVNGRIFLNNVSLGVYGRAVRRPAYRDAKLRVLLATLAEVLGPGGETSSLRLVDDLGRDHVDPLVVLVSNNPYALEPGSPPGRRPALDGGRLGVLVIDPPGGRPAAPARAWNTAVFEVHAAMTLHAGIDGEAADLRAPLHFAVRPAALRVRIPATTKPRPE